VKSKKLKVKSKKEVGFCFSLYFLLFTFNFLLFTSHLSVAWADTPMTITADQMEHFQDKDKYVATGNVKLEKDKIIVYADKAVFFARASYLEAQGHVIYEDPTTLINADRAELSMDTKTGKIYNALIHLKDQKAFEKKIGNIDFWINSEKVEKINDSHYYAPEATFTSCETLAETEGRYLSPDKNKAFGADNPDWCLKGSNVDILIGNRISGSDMVYRVKGFSTVYFPYFSIPDRDRQTGLIMPLLGHTSTQGFVFKPAFFWAIDENKDATFNLDYFSKRGVGEGIEYRYLDFDDNGKWYLFHLGDTQENKTDIVVKGMHEQKFGDLKVFADIDYVNQWDYYNQFGLTPNDRIQRYTQSSAEISTPFRDSRLYMLGQYWVDLQVPPQLQSPPLPLQPVPQRLPEVGYVLNPTNIGPLMFSMNSSIADFTRSGGEAVDGQRLNIYPKLWHSFGDAVQVFQSLSLSETAYNLSNAGTTYNSNLHRETIEYNAYALTRFFKQYESGAHTIEPSLSFTFSPGYSRSLPVFDSVDVNNNTYFSQPAGTYAMINKTALAQFSVLNTFSLKGYNLAARLIQPYTFNSAEPYASMAVSNPSHPLQPTTLWVGLTSGLFNLTLNEIEDLNTLKQQSSTDTFSVKVAEGTTVSLSRSTNISTVPVTNQYIGSVSTILSKAFTVTANMWYDVTLGSLQSFAVHTLYNSQCWGLDVSFQRTPPDTIHPQNLSFMFTVVLKGFGGLKLYQVSP
jgi:LPS-assembly protein